MRCQFNARGGSVFRLIWCVICRHDAESGRKFPIVGSSRYFLWVCARILPSPLPVVPNQ